MHGANFDFVREREVTQGDRTVTSEALIHDKVSFSKRPGVPEPGDTALGLTARAGLVSFLLAATAFAFRGPDPGDTPRC